MKAAVPAVLLGLLLTPAVAAALAARAPARVLLPAGIAGSSCTAPLPPGASAAGSKASSFAPQHGSRRRVYGAPIQRPIVSRRGKHKRHVVGPAQAPAAHPRNPPP
jgi:hypothetical protein